MADFSEEFTNLRVSQVKMNTLLEGLDSRVSGYFEVDEERFRDLNNSRIEFSKHLAEVATVVKDLKVSHDCVVKKDIPELQKDVSGHKKKIESHSWLLRAVVGATIIASLGGLFGGLSNCTSSNAIASEGDQVVGIADADSDGDE